MFSSTIIPTIGRDSLALAVESVLSQVLSGENFQVIVVNDTGHHLPFAGWQTHPRVTILETQRRERSVARNTGAAISLGRYLHFLDDDDLLLPGALEALRQITRESDADWVYGRTMLVDRMGKPQLVLNQNLQGNLFVQVMAGEWIPLQSSLIRAQAFFDAGGFDPHLSGPEDIDLQRRIAFSGSFARTQAITARVAMGSSGSSTDWSVHASAAQQARDAVLNQAGCWGRLRRSAAEASEHTGYWRGRIARLYLTSFVWNMRRRQTMTAVNRASYGGAALLLSGRYLLRRETWQAVTRAYQSFSFAGGDSQPNEAGTPTG
jgi:GT2 family glycosyltransferase